MQLSEVTPQNGSADIEKLTKLHQKLQRRRAHQELEWQLNELFVAGKQYYTIDRGRVIPLRRGPKWRARARVNKLRPGVDRLTAKMTKHDPVMEALARTGDASARKSAQFAEMLFESKWRDLDIAGKRDRAVRASLVIGRGHLECGYDAFAYKPREVVLDPESGLPVVDEQRLEALKAQAAAGAIELEKKLAYNGEITVEYLHARELFFIGGDGDYLTAKAALKVTGREPDDIKARWPDKWGKDGIPCDAHEDQEPGVQKAGERKKGADRITLYELYIRPSAANPKGRYVAWVKNRVLSEVDFPYNDKKLPFVSIGDDTLPPLLTDMVPIQAEINRAHSQFIEHRNMAAAPRHVVNHGVIDPNNPIGTEPGGFYAINMALGKPEVLQVPELPSSVYQHLQRLEEELDNLIGLQDASKGQAPTNVESFAALTALQEASDEVMGPRVKQMERALSDLGDLILSRAKQFYIEPRTISVTGAAGALAAKTFSRTDLEGCSGIRVVPGSTLPRSKAAQQDFIYKLINGGVLTWQQGLPMLEFGGSSDVLARWEAAKGRQQREIDRVLRGEPIEAPKKWEDDDAAIEVLLSLFNSPEFDAYDPEHKAILEEHLDAHEQNKSAKAPPPKPPELRLNGQLRGDIPVSAAASMLNAAGVQVDPAQMAEEQATFAEHQASANADGQVKVHAAKAETDANERADQAQLDAALSAMTPAPNGNGATDGQ